jgi:hypothetical protein
MSNQNTENRRLRIKLASAILNLDAIQRELSKYDTHRLFKSAAVGAHKAERMKVAALVRQQEIEKQAIGAFLGQLALGGAKMGLKGLGGLAKGALKTVGAGANMIGRGAWGKMSGQGARAGVAEGFKQAPGYSSAAIAGTGATAVPYGVNKAKQGIQAGAGAIGKGTEALGDYAQQGAAALAKPLQNYASK